MDYTDTTHQKRPFRRRFINPWFLAIILAAAILAAGLSVLPRSHASDTLRRYVSPVLPDGSRITFLYPEELKVRFNRANPFLLIMTRRGPRWRLLPPWWGDREVVLAADLAPQPQTARRAPFRLKRWDIWIRGTIQHSVYLKDEHGKLRYHFIYECIDRARRDALDPKITSSFQALPPGAPVPSP